MNQELWVYTAAGLTRIPFVAFQATWHPAQDPARSRLVLLFVLHAEVE